MLAVAFALLSAFGFGASNIFAKWGMRTASPISATVISTLVNILVYWSILLGRGGIDRIPAKALVIFILAGLLSPALGRFFGFLGIARLGVTRAHPVIATMPIVTMLVAIAAFGEPARLPLVLGTLVCVGGVALLTAEREEGRIQRAAYLFPILSALTFGVSVNLRQLGLHLYPHALAGAAITITSGMLCLVGVSLLRSHGRDLVGDRRSLLHFSGAGVFSMVAVYANFKSLQLGNIIVVTTLMNTAPLFSMVLSLLLLRDSEFITLRVVAATCLVVLGASLVTLFR